MGYLVDNTTFTPFSYEELVKPIAEYTQAYNDAADKYNAAQVAANKVMSNINKDKDPESYQKYQDFLNGVKQQANDIASNGLNPSYQQNLRDLNLTYSKDIYPIDAQIQKKMDYAKVYQESLNNSKEIIGVNPDNLSIDAMMKNPNTPLPIFNGETVKKDMADYFSKATLSPDLFGKLDVKDETVNRVYSVLREQYGVDAKNFQTLYDEVKNLDATEAEKRLFLDNIKNHLVEMEMAKLNINDYPNLSEEIKANLKKQIENYADFEEHNVIGPTQITPSSTAAGLRAGATKISTTTNLINSEENETEDRVHGPLETQTKGAVNFGVFVGKNNSNDAISKKTKGIITTWTDPTTKKKYDHLDIDNAMVSYNKNKSTNVIAMFGSKSVPIGDVYYFKTRQQFKKEAEGQGLKGNDLNEVMSQYDAIGNLLTSDDLGVKQQIENGVYYTKQEYQKIIDDRLNTPIGQMLLGKRVVKTINIPLPSSAANSLGINHIKTLRFENYTAFNYSTHHGKTRWYGEKDDGATTPMQLSLSNKAQILKLDYSPYANCILVKIEGSQLDKHNKPKDGATPQTRTYLLRPELLSDEAYQALKDIHDNYLKYSEDYESATDPTYKEHCRQVLSKYDIQAQTIITKALYSYSAPANINNVSTGTSSSKKSTQSIKITTTKKQNGTR